MIDDAPVDEQAEAALLAFVKMSGPPPRLRWSAYIGNGYRVPPGQITTAAVGRARGRASARLIAAHRAEFDAYWIEDQWKIANGTTL